MEYSVDSNVLIAQWSRNNDSPDTPPHKVLWSDGRPATLHDYYDHSLDTWTLRFNGDGIMECRMYPDIIAEVWFDDVVKTWFIGGTGVEPAILGLTSREVGDDEIKEKLYHLPVSYRYVIHRELVTSVPTEEQICPCGELAICLSSASYCSCLSSRAVQIPSEVPL